MRSRVLLNAIAAILVVGLSSCSHDVTDPLVKASKVDSTSKTITLEIDSLNNCQIIISGLSVFVRSTIVSGTRNGQQTSEVTESIDLGIDDSFSVASASQKGDTISVSRGDVNSYSYNSVSIVIDTASRIIKNLFWHRKRTVFNGISGGTVEEQLTLDSIPYRIKSTILLEGQMVPVTNSNIVDYHLASAIDDNSHYQQIDSKFIKVDSISSGASIQLILKQ